MSPCRRVRDADLAAFLILIMRKGFEITLMRRNILPKVVLLYRLTAARSVSARRAPVVYRSIVARWRCGNSRQPSANYQMLVRFAAWTGEDQHATQSKHSSSG